MKKRAKAFLVSMGSVISLYPATNYANLVNRATPEERMRSHWEQVGRHLRVAMDKERQAQDEQNKKG
jgi:hypothetical protein